MTLPLSISVVMPSFNHAHFIRESIESVLSQDYPHIELLVMDGGSTDSTVEILKSYGTRLMFISEKDHGQSDAINKGLKRVNGDIVCWLNSDDLFTPGAVSTVMRIFLEHPEVDFVYGNGWTIDEKGRMLGSSGVLPFDRWKLIHQRNFLQQPSCFFRKSLLKKAGMIDETLHYVMDWELWIRFSAYKEFYTEAFLSYNRTYNENKTQSGHFKRWKEIYRVVRKYTDAFCPPILGIYLLEVTIHYLASKRVPHKLLVPLLNQLMRLSQREMSGCYPNGAVSRRFMFSIGNLEQKSQVKFRLRPLSATIKDRIAAEPVTINWRSNTGTRGSFVLIENGEEQDFLLSVNVSPLNTGFVHFKCEADFAGINALTGSSDKSDKIIAYLREVSVI